MNKKILLTAALVLSPLFGAINTAFAQCANPTCISGAMIDLAEGKNITWDPIDTHYDALNPTAACNSKPAIMTGVRTYLWFASDKDGRWVNGPDGFCTLPGSSFKTNVNATGITSPKCE